MNERHAPASAIARPPLPLVLDWPVGTMTAPELWALHLTLRYARGPSRVIPIVPPSQGGLIGLPVGELDGLREAITSSLQPHQALLDSPDGAPIPAMSLRMLGRGLRGLPDVLPRRTIVRAGVVNDTDTDFDASTRARGQEHDVLIARSAWARDLLSANGLHGVKTLATGVDTALFAPGVATGDLANRFVIFSAGRLCHRKGQDLVLAAVKIFCKRHPETLLLTLWQSPVPESALDITRAGLVSSAPHYHAGQLQIAEWAVREGLPGGCIIELGAQPQRTLATIMNEVDVALFPNRAEADANSHVLECMAKGIPVILSNNTGHRDVAGSGHAWPLEHQGALRGNAVVGTAAGSGVDGWGESSVDEMVEHLERVHANRDGARARAARARAVILSFDWATVSGRLTALLAPFAARARAA